MKNCKKCDRPFNPIPGLVNYCSLSCRNNRGRRNELTKEKISKAVQKYWTDNPVAFRYKKCIVCGDEFKCNKTIRTTCGEICKNYILSLKRQNYIVTNGTNNFKTERKEFKYKHINLETDSDLERIAIIYLVDKLHADKIERYKNILNFWEGNSHRTFNPDFYVKIGDQIYIVEVKMRWLEDSNHDYNRTIPLKKIALQQYCDLNHYKMIWLDFDYDTEFLELYKNRKKLLL